MPKKLISRLDKLISILIKAVIFILPLFFLPWTNEYFEFNKQFLLWLVMPLALFLWLIKQALEGEIKIKVNPLNLPIIIFLALTGLSALLSLDIFSSFFGSYGRFSDAWLGLMSLVIFYFLLINAGLADSTKKIFILIKLLFYSAMAIAAVSLLAMFGLTRALTGDWLNILASASFNPAGGSLLSLAVFLAVMAVLAAGFLFSRVLKKNDRIIFSIGLALFLAAMALINFYLSWVILAAGSSLLLGGYFLEAGISRKKILNYYLLIPAALMLAAVLMLVQPGISPAKIILGGELSREATPDYKTSVLITKKALVKNPILGSGPATFSHDFSLYRPAEFNQNNYWQIRFDRSFSQFLEIAATLGLPAGLSYLLIICLVIYINIILFIRYFKNRDLAGESGDYNLSAAIFTVFILLFIAQLFFSFNTVLNFSFWFFLGLVIAFWQSRNQAIFKEKIIYVRSETAGKAILFSKIWFLILFFLGALWLILAAFEVKFFAADLAAAGALNREAGLLTAVRLNSNRANYDISLAKFYLNRARLEAVKPKAEKDDNFIQLNISRAIEAGRSAVAAAPNSVQAQETLAMIYRDVRPLTVGSEFWAARFFENALALEPANPVLAAELGKAYLNINDLANAEKYFIKSAELKPDYYEAKFGLAKVYLKNKKDGPALSLLNELAAEVYDPEIFYELGRFYFNHGETDKAIDRFKLVLSVSPKHSNGLYSLGIAYEAKGDIKEALKYYEKVLELNQGNKEVEAKIKELNK